MALDHFPLQGIIGLVASSDSEVELALEHRLRCIEVRADLLFDNGLDEESVLSLVHSAHGRGLKVLVTQRRADHGGKFSGPEQARVDFCLKAIEAGANIIDVEWDSESGEQLIARNVPTILSYHNFESTPTDTELRELTAAMMGRKPTALKVVPTARSMDDSLRMLNWVAEHDNDHPRIGFAMGAKGAFSRLLTLQFGSPISYGSFAEAHAPGQFSISQMQSVYQIESINQSTQLVGLLAEDGQCRQWAEQIARADSGVTKTVGLPLPVKSADELARSLQAIGSNRVLASNAMALEILGILKGRDASKIACVGLAMGQDGSVSTREFDQDEEAIDWVSAG